MASVQERPVSVEDYVAAHKDKDPQALLQLLMQRDRVPVGEDGTFAPRTLEDVQRIARMYSESDLVPDAYKGKMANCAIAIEYAQQLKIPPLAFMQHSFIVRGRPAIDAIMMIGLLNKSKKLKTSLQYTSGGEGKSRWWKATAVDASTGEPVSFTVTWEMVEAEGWHLERGETRMKSKWVTLPDLMGRYRAASYLIRTHYPDILLGLCEVEELRDVERAEQQAFAETVRESVAAVGSRPKTLSDVAAMTATATATATTAAKAEMAKPDDKPAPVAEVKPTESVKPSPLPAFLTALEKAKTEEEALACWSEHHKALELATEDEQAKATAALAKKQAALKAGKRGGA